MLLSRVVVDWWGVLAGSRFGRGLWAALLWWRVVVRVPLVSRWLLDAVLACMCRVRRWAT